MTNALADEIERLVISFSYEDVGRFAFEHSPEIIAALRSAEEVGKKLDRLTRREARLREALENCEMVMGDTKPVDWEDDFSKAFQDTLRAARGALSEDQEL